MRADLLDGHHSGPRLIGLLASPRHTYRRGREELRGLYWAWSAHRRLRRDLDTVGLNARVLEPADLHGSSFRRIELALRLRRATCLERALILQRWLLENGYHRAVIIGVAGEGGVIGAHAWLEGEDPRGNLELERLEPTR